MRSERIAVIARRATTVASIVLTAAFLFPVRDTQARQSAGVPDAKQEVPGNLADHVAPMQPISYSHQTHLALGLQCLGCHANPDPGNLMTFPAASSCMSCHRTVSKNKPAIQKLASFAKSREPIPWVRVYTLTPGVNWTHRKHLEAGVTCETCHGQVAEMAAMSQTTGVTAMGVCINCHKLHNAPTVCQTCHAWPSN